MISKRITLYLTETPKIVPHNSYWIDQVTNPDNNIVSFIDTISLKMVYEREYKGFEIIADSILIKVGRYTHKNGEKVNITPMYKKVKCLNNGIVYKSSKEAEKDTKVPASMVARIARGVYPSSNGFVFAYL